MKLNLIKTFVIVLIMCFSLPLGHSAKNMYTIEDINENDIIKVIFHTRDNIKFETSTSFSISDDSIQIQEKNSINSKRQSSFLYSSNNKFTLPCKVIRVEGKSIYIQGKLSRRLNNLTEIIEFIGILSTESLQGNMVFSDDVIFEEINVTSNIGE